jgi:hypothetical protein
MLNIKLNKPEFKEIDPFKVMLNVGCLMDIPTGQYVKGTHGESILNGGFPTITAIAGRGNTFKSTIAHYMVLRAMENVLESGLPTFLNSYDTEMNISKERLRVFYKDIQAKTGVDLFEEGVWSVSDKSVHSGNEWFKILRDYLKKEKIENKKDLLVDTPFIDTKGQRIKTMLPTFGEIDSISEFTTDDIEEIQDKNEIGEPGGNMIHARLGLAKTRMMMELPYLCNASSHYMVMTAHLGESMLMQQGPYNIPSKALQYMKQGEKIKGVTDKIFFLTNSLWQTVSSSVLINQGTKGPEYPKERDLQDDNPSDLNIVTIKQLRNKSGPSGITLELIISQREGVLPSLTEFHFIKSNDRFGLTGNNINYALVLYPEVKLQRTTVRSLIDNDPKLRRAIKITSDLLQIKKLWVDKNMELPTPEELYEKLKKKYDWNTLLDTRDNWLFGNADKAKPFLSTMDLINMYHDRYTPYWLK